MLKFKFLFILTFLTCNSYSKSKLYYGQDYGKKVFVEMRDDSTVTIVIVESQKRQRGCIYFLEPGDYYRSKKIYQMQFTRWHKNYWITNFKATKKKESVNDLPKEKVEIGKKRDWLYIFNFPDVSVDFPLKKVMCNSYAQEEYRKLILN